MKKQSPEIKDELKTYRLVPVKTVTIPYIPEFKTNVLIDDITGNTYVKVFKKQDLVRICIIPFSETTLITSYGYESKDSKFNIELVMRN